MQWVATADCVAIGYDSRALLRQNFQSSLSRQENSWRNRVCLASCHDRESYVATKEAWPHVVTVTSCCERAWGLAGCAATERLAHPTKHDCVSAV